ncbi:MAG: ribosome maturation factor RimP [Gammaproteobacteria bacterium]|nr:ribosome maturation factor RimP [Gammaproteobacteria bacterium]MCK5499151.1 ribosome maturation factor RimP [Gammaproteobacteria bacterium]MCK5667872.1 ribosome maturation factor RimP [Gammaproteobacteria bacterium]
MHRQHSELIELLEPVVTALGYEMLGIEYFKQKGGSLLRLYIDSDAGITLDDCARVNQQVIGVLDVHDPIKERYNLEISSPGLDRPLFTLNQFQRFLGQEVKIKLHEKIDERRKITGVIKAIKDSAVIVSEEGVDYIIPADVIDSAHLVPEI